MWSAGAFTCSWWGVPTPGALPEAGRAAAAVLSFWFEHGVSGSVPSGC